MENHDARGYFALKKNISVGVLKVYTHLALTGIPFTGINSTTYKYRCPQYSNVMPSRSSATLNIVWKMYYELRNIYLSFRAAH